MCYSLWYNAPTMLQAGGRPATSSWVHFIPLQNVVYFITLHFWFVKYSHFTYMMCYHLNVQFQDQRVKVSCDEDRA